MSAIDLLEQDVKDEKLDGTEPFTAIRLLPMISVHASLLSNDIVGTVRFYGERAEWEQREFEEQEAKWEAGAEARRAEAREKRKRRKEAKKAAKLSKA